MDWLQRITASVAHSANIDPAELTLTPEDRIALLDIARVASHTSGDRTNAPLLCFVLGIAFARGAKLDDLCSTVEEAAG